MQPDADRVGGARPFKPLAPAPNAPSAQDELEVIYQAAPIGLCVFDRDARYRRINDRLAEINGVPAGDHIGRTISEMVPDLADQAMALFNRVLSGERVWGVEIEGQTPAQPGVVRIWRESWIPLCNASGEVQGVLVAADEITDEKKAARALAESEETLRGVLDGMAECFGLLAPDFTILLQNAEALRLDGRPASEIIGKKHWDAYPGSESSPLGDLYKKAMADRRPATYEHKYVWPDGREMWLDMRAYPSPDGGLAVFWRDITEKKKSEEALRSAEQRYRAIFNRAGVGIARVCVSGSFLEINDRYCEILRRSREDILSEGWKQITHPDDLEADLAHVGQLLEGTADSFQMEKRYLAPDDGPDIWVNMTVVAIRHQDGSVAYFIPVVEDITARKKAVERERLLMREIDHRARNLLSVMQAVMKLTRADDLDTYKRAVEGRIRALGRAHTLLSSSQWEGVDLEKLAWDELSMFAETDATRVALSGPKMRLSPQQSQALSLLLHELATNAAKHGALSEDKGKIALSWRRSGPADAQSLDLVWAERGGPEVATAPNRRGFGSQLIRVTIEQQLGGRLAYDWRPEGLQVRIAIPLAET